MRKDRKKSRNKMVFTLLLLTLSVSTAFFAFLFFYTSGDKALSGEWSAKLDMTEYAAFTAFTWLQDIEAVSVSLEDMGAYLQDLTIEVDLTLEQADRFGGTFRCEILPESYDACNQAAYEGFAMAFKELLGERLSMAGYTGGTDGEAVEALVTETFGMSTVSYLMSCGPALLPPLEELQAQYGGSGTYETADGILTRQFDDGGEVASKREKYVLKDGMLILSQEAGAAPSALFLDQYPLLYTLKQNQ